MRWCSRHGQRHGPEIHPKAATSILVDELLKIRRPKRPTALADHVVRPLGTAEILGPHPVAHAFQRPPWNVIFAISIITCIHSRKCRMGEGFSRQARQISAGIFGAFQEDSTQYGGERPARMAFEVANTGSKKYIRGHLTLPPV